MTLLAVILIVFGLMLLFFGSRLATLFAIGAGVAIGFINLAVMAIGAFAGGNCIDRARSVWAEPGG
jgi:hypothetical protein